MPVQFVEEIQDALKIGTRFYAVDETGVFVCQVKNSECTEAFVLNIGKVWWTVRIVEKKQFIRIPYLVTRSPIPIRHVGDAPIPDPTNVEEGAKWAKEKWGGTAREREAKK